jgi:hypothetical protein
MFGKGAALASVAGSPLVGLRDKRERGERHTASRASGALPREPHHRG